MQTNSILRRTRATLRAFLATCLAAVAVTADAAAQTYDQCGTVEQGVTCPKLFRDDAGGLWILDTSLAAYQVGDRLRVQGDAAPGCISICQQGNGCINNSVLSASCGLSLPSICTPGVPNSTGAAGQIQASGSATVALNDLTLEAQHLPAGSFAFFITSRTVIPPVSMPGGSQGNLCLGGAIGRFVQQVGVVDAAGRYTISTDPNAGAQRFDLANVPQPAGAVAVMPGESWSFQCWHRDFVAGQATSNFTEGITITFT